MNIAVVNVRDLFKYILKFCLILFLILLITKGVKAILKIKETVNMKETIEENSSKINKKTYTECLDLSLSLMSYKKSKQEIKLNVLSNKKILSYSSGIIDEKILTEYKINEEKLASNDLDELKDDKDDKEIKEIIEEFPKDASIEQISKNNIDAKFNTSYNNVKIDNQSDYEITQEMLVPDVEITNKKDILIYHTHTCESYTPSERI